MSSLDSLTAAVAAAPDARTSVERLVDVLAERIKATSNDQNIQRLARDLKVAAPDLARAIADKVSAA